MSHVYGPGHYDEDLFRDLDQLLDICRRHRIRVIIPFIDEWDWFGGIDQFARFRGKTGKEFYSDPQIQEDFRHLVKTIVTRVNTVNGIPYNEDPTILAWESANELREDPEAWLCELAAFVKSLAPKQLFQDGHCGIRQQPLHDPNVDLLTVHYYGNFDYAGAARGHREETRGTKPLYIGEYDPRNTGNLLEEVIANGSTGAMAWGLRGRAWEGGFFCHFDPLYYHWPYSPVTQQLRQAAYAIQGLEVPPVPVPLAPEMIPSDNPRRLTWRGSTGADGYTLERALSPDGPWEVIAEGVSDHRCAGETLFDDAGAPNAWPIFYRIKATNASGESPWSPVMRCGR
jgi:hypothetical protein